MQFVADGLAQVGELFALGHEDDCVFIVGAGTELEGVLLQSAVYLFCLKVRMDCSRSVRRWLSMVGTVMFFLSNHSGLML